MSHPGQRESWFTGVLDLIVQLLVGAGAIALTAGALWLVWGGAFSSGYTDGNDYDPDASAVEPVIPPPPPDDGGFLDGPDVGCVIKGNLSVESGEAIYHVPGQEYYDETVINEAYGERWFCSEEEALSAGWRRSEV